MKSSRIEAEFRRLNRLRFSPDLEARFDVEGLDHRKRVGRISLSASLLIYDLTLFMDWSVLPDMVGWVALFRLGMFTPIVLLILWVLPRTTAIWQVDSMAIAGTLTAVLLPMAAMIFSQSDYAFAYQFGTMLTITYFTLVQRVRFRFAAVGLAVTVAVQLWCVAQRSDIDETAYFFVVNFFVSGALLLLMGSYILERGERLGFLERLRSELLIEHIERTSRLDGLTGLSNRYHLAEIGERLVRQSADIGIASIMIDIDHFKRLNDTQGHLAGDSCIRTVADIIRDALQRNYGGEAEAGTAFRFGGEEFLLLLPGCGVAQASMLGETIRRGLNVAKLPHPSMGESAQVTVSIGVAACQGPQISLQALIGAADAALYRAKHEGRDRLCIAA